MGYLAHLIQAVFGDGAKHGVSISYHHEETPLGTAGALAKIEHLDDTFLFMNGDVLTTIDYNKLYDVHKEAGNVLTIASHRRAVETDYGVIHTNGAAGETRIVSAYEEKPVLPMTVSMGVYVAEPSMLEHIPGDRHFDMPDVVLKLIAAGKQVGSYIYDGFWLDIGRHEDYELAIREYETISGSLYREQGEPGDADPAHLTLIPPENRGSA